MMIEMAKWLLFAIYVIWMFAIQFAAPIVYPALKRR